MLTFRWIFYSDTFDENTPPVDDPDYISSLGAAIYRGMQSGDENAVWLMQVNKKKCTIILANLLPFVSLLNEHHTNK